ncbi:unnamed protein product [Urochloa humidicola]
MRTSGSAAPSSAGADGAAAAAGATVATTTSARQSGHVAFPRNQASMHSAWNLCPHRGSARAFSPGSSSARQTAQSPITPASSTTTGILASTAGSSPRGDGAGPPSRSSSSSPPAMARLRISRRCRLAASDDAAAAAGGVVEVERDEREEHARERPRRGEQELSRDGVVCRAVHLPRGSRDVQAQRRRRRLGPVAVARYRRAVRQAARAVAGAGAGAHGRWWTVERSAS